MEEQRVQYEEKKSSRLIDWLLFLLFAAGTVALLQWQDRFFWVLLPFAFLYLVKALRMM